MKGNFFTEKDVFFREIEPPKWFVTVFKIKI